MVSAYKEEYIGGGARLWTTRSGDDPAKDYVILCGGGPGIGDSLADVGAMLDDRLNVVRYEARGCGRSEQDGCYDIDTCAADLERICLHLGAPRVYVLGHSWGAGVALFYALAHPDACRGVIYLSGIGLQNDVDFAEEFSRNSEALGAPEVELPPDFRVNYDVCNAGLASYNRRIKSPSLLREASRLNVPVLVVSGERDIRPLWPADQLAQLLPRARRVVMSGCGHFPWLDDAESLKLCLNAFIEAVGRGCFTGDFE